MEAVTGLGFAAGSACCCIAVFLVALVALSLAFRPSRPKGADLAGLSPAPVRGVQTVASMTRLEENAQTTVIPIKSAPRPSNVVPSTPPPSDAPAPPDPTASIPPPVETQATKPKG